MLGFTSALQVREIPGGQVVLKNGMPVGVFEMGEIVSMNEDARRLSTSGGASPLRPQQPCSEKAASLDNDTFALEASSCREDTAAPQLKRAATSYKGKTVDLSGKYRANYDRQFGRSHQAQQAFVDLFRRESTYQRVQAEAESLGLDAERDSSRSTAVAAGNTTRSSVYSVFDDEEPGDMENRDSNRDSVRSSNSVGLFREKSLRASEWV